MALERLDVMRKGSRTIPGVFKIKKQPENKKEPATKNICPYKQLGLPKRITQGYLILATYCLISLGYGGCNPEITQTQEKPIVQYDKGIPAGVPTSKINQYNGGK